MTFLNDLGSALSSQFSLGENDTTSLNSVVDGQTQKYGSLGSLAGNFDESAQRSYIEAGYLRRDPYNSDPKLYEILLQEPSATVLVKKRMFSSIAENFRPDFMDADEKLYYKAMKVLFQNKCNQIQILEKLAKIQKITAAVGNVSDQLVPVIITLTDQLTNAYGDGINLFGTSSPTNPLSSSSNGSSFTQIVDRLRVLYAYNQTNPYTTWITDSTDMFQSTLGQGTGVMEITNFTRISTTVSTTMDNGRFDFSISDPYESMLITDFDIEKALSDATNAFYNDKSYQFGVTSAEQVIADAQNKLNQARASRNASPITINTDPDTLLGKRVTAIIDKLALEIPFTYDSTGGTGFPGLGGAGNSVSVPAPYLQGGTIAGYDGLSNGNLPLGPDQNITPLVSQSELSLFQSLIAAIYNKISLMANSANNFTTTNKDTNYARKKLRFNFSGKLIIQPMDTVHIYMNSKSRFDNKILSGLENMMSGLGVLQNVNNTLTDITNSFDALFRPAGSTQLQTEKSIYAGPDFPNYLWTLLRSQFVTEKEGTHVFAGVVNLATDSWNAGAFTINVNGFDNTYYFDQGKINFNPGIDAFNGAIFDPLTPFKSNFNTISSNTKTNTPDLLDENTYLLSDTGKKSLAKHKIGPYAGEKVTQTNYLQDKSIDPVTGRLLKVFYAPDGLVYKWKEGIGVFTQSGNTTTNNDPNLVGSPNIFTEPFAGLDVMNVLSLLISGVPYNFATFFNAASSLGGLGNDPQSKQSSSGSFISYLRNELQKRNSLWGNFIPFKNLTMNESAIAQFMQAQQSVSQTNAALDAQLQQFSQLNQRAAMLGAVNALASKVTNAQSNAGPDITNLNASINNLQKQIQSQLLSIQNDNKTTAANTGLDASYDSTSLQDTKYDPSDSGARKNLRKQLNYLTRRMSYDVRANDDKNLFIVDDYYDVDYDIAAFNQLPNNAMKLYSNTYTSVKQNIENVANLLNLEVFADTQGHIRVRSPQYNRMPSSVFYRMMYLKKSLGVQVFPEFLNDMFKSQLDTLKQQIEILEDEIRLDCAILGHKSLLDDDSDSANYINSSSAASGLGGIFIFLSDPSSGNINDYNNLIQQANQDVALSNTAQNLNDVGSSTKQVFNNSARYTILVEALQQQNAAQAGLNTSLSPDVSILSSTVVQTLISRISFKSGQSLSTKDYIVSSNGPNSPVQISSSQTIDYFKVTQEITTYIQQWQRAVKLFYHTVKNAQEYKSLDDDSSTSNNLITPGNYNNSYIPEVYEHMIEDESYDDYGFGSGQRYVIKRAQIKSLSISEQAPPYTAVEVHGTLGFGFGAGQGAAGLDNSLLSGNGQVSAVAIDYDLWRNYGFKSQASLPVPFLSDPETQCGPYAAMVLSRNRAEVLGGTCLISGNEFMQPGEVVYLEDRGMLFYISSVSHEYASGTSFTTTLQLGYGHTPGDYIPTYLDTVGKLLYKNKESGSTIIQRQDSSGNDTNMGVVQIDGSLSLNSINTGDETDTQNPVAASNNVVMNNILYQTAYIINKNNSAGNNVQAAVELRLYYDNTSGSADGELLDFANTVKQYLTGGSTGPKLDGNSPVKNPTLPSNAVNIVSVNLDDPNDRRSPSQKAHDAARNQLANISLNSQKAIDQNTLLRGALFGYVIDCWVSIKQVDGSTTSSAGP
jgi:hypothetical protein